MKILCCVFIKEKLSRKIFGKFFGNFSGIFPESSRKIPSNPAAKPSVFFPSRKTSVQNARSKAFGQKRPVEPLGRNLRSNSSVGILSRTLRSKRSSRKGRTEKDEPKGTNRKCSPKPKTAAENAARSFYPFTISATNSLKVFPRSSKLRKRSKLAEAGVKMTLSPLFA